MCELAETPGRRGEPLVGTYPLELPNAYQAGLRPAQRMAPDLADKEFRKRYSQNATLAEYGREGVSQIHQHKFAEELARTQAGLLWPPWQRHRGAWFAVHPVIGDIIISTAAAASDISCVVLTDTQRDHRAAPLDEEAVDCTLLGRDELGAGRRPAPVEIGNLVIATTWEAKRATWKAFMKRLFRLDAAKRLRMLLRSCLSPQVRS